MKDYDFKVTENGMLFTDDGWKTCKSSISPMIEKQRKFQVIIFYETKEKLDWYLRGFQFDEPFKFKEYKQENLIHIEYEHFIIRCFKRLPTQSFRGWKCDLVAVENSIYDAPEYVKYYQDVICGMLVPQRFDIGVQVF